MDHRRAEALSHKTEDLLHSKERLYRTSWVRAVLVPCPLPKLILLSQIFR